MYTTLQYFLKSYCTLSIHEDEIASVMEEFIEQEDEEIVLKLRDELVTMKKERVGRSVRISCEARKSYVVFRRNERSSGNLYILKKRRDLLTPFSLCF